MNNLFVPYQESFELKELGFDEHCFGFYTYQKQLRRYINFDGELNEFQTLKNSKITMGNEWCTAPIFSQAFKWFREKHNLMFQIFYLRNGNYSVIIHKTTPEYMGMIDQIGPSIGCFDEIVDCYSYEEAEIECLKKLIQIVKTK